MLRAQIRIDSRLVIMRARNILLLAALSRDRYAKAFEIGCPIGILTRLFGERCDSLLSMDLVEWALQQARERCAAERNVRFARMRVPDECPNESLT